MDCGGRPSAIGRAAHESLCVELLPVTKRISGWHSACKGPRTTRTTMTTCLKLTALFSLAALSSAAAAESAGLPIPSFATGEAALSLFVIATAFLMFGHDYGRRESLDTPSPRQRLLPAKEAFRPDRAPLAGPRRRDRRARTFKPTVML